MRVEKNKDFVQIEQDKEKLKILKAGGAMNLMQITGNPWTEGGSFKTQ